MADYLNRVIFLLDVPALVALCCTSHPEHKKITAWTRETGIATCPFTQAGLLSSPAIDAGRARKFLDKLFYSSWHNFWPCDLQFRSPRLPPVRSPGEIVTGYLLGLASSRAGKLATLDPEVLRMAGAEDRAVLVKWPNSRRAASLRAFAREVKAWQGRGPSPQAQALQPKPRKVPVRSIPRFPDQVRDRGLPIAA